MLGNSLPCVNLHRHIHICGVRVKSFKNHPFKKILELIFKATMPSNGFVGPVVMMSLPPTQTEALFWSTSRMEYFSPGPNEKKKKINLKAL